MVRCPTCGIRLGEDAAVCPTHGALPAVAPAPTRDPEPSGVAEAPPPTLAGFTVSGLLGRGGFGAVYRARRNSSGIEVAIKVARADQFSASERLLLEAGALTAIGRPWVPEVYDVGHLPDGAAYVVMEFVSAPTLAVRLTEAAGPLPLPELYRLGPALVNVVARAHDKGFLHGDLKPENVFVLGPTAGDAASAAANAPEAAAPVRLFDFGLVRRLDIARTNTGEELPEGTPEYMSPEQCEGGTLVDARSDIYSLGVMLYEMATGAPPFWGRAAEVQLGHRSRRPPAPSRRAPVDEAVEAVILRCLAKDPARRFASAREVEGALRAAAAAHVAKTAQPSPSHAAPPVVAPPKPFVTETRTVDATSTRERRVLALAFFETKAMLPAVREALAAAGGELGHVAGIQVVVAFGHEVGDNPTRAALRAAQLFVDRGLTQRVLVDLGAVAITIRKTDGTRRYQSPSFTKKDQYPSEADPPGVILARAAADLLPDVATDPIARRPDHALVRRTEDASEATSMRADLPQLVGRDQILRVLLGAARRALEVPLPGRAGTPTISTVTGEAGVGKSHLGSVLGQQLESINLGGKVVTFRAKEALGGAGDQTTRDLFRRFLELPATSPPEFGRTLLAERLGTELAREVWAGVAVTMGWASPDHPELRALAAAPGALRAAAARAAGEALRAAARRQPLAVIIEDAQFADETALDALEYAALREAGCPIWILILARPTFGTGRTAWATRAAVTQRLELGPLDEAAAVELTRRLLAPAEGVPGAAIAKLVERTQRNPLLLVELVRGLKRDGLIRRSDRTGTWFLATDELDRLPDLPLVQWLAGRETESLPPDLAGHARLASILGVEFDADEMDGVMQILEREGVTTSIGTQLDAGVGIGRLVGAGLLVRHRQGRVGFRLALLRDTLYRTVPQAEREAIHGAAYRFFAAATGLSDELRLPKMAAHAAASGLRQQAAAIYLDLARRSERRHAYLDAELLYRSAIDNLGDAPDDASGDAPGDDRLIAARRGLGTMRLRLGRHEDALKDLAAARAAARRLARREPEIEIVLDEALVLDWVGDWARSAAMTDEAQALATGGSTPIIDARLVYAHARTFHRADKPAEAAAAFAKSAEMAEELGDEGYETYVLGLSLLGWNLSLLRRFDEADAVFARLISTCEARGDILNLTVALNNRAILSLLSKNVDRLVQDYRRLIVIARERGLPLVECSAAKDLAEVQYLLGEGEAEDLVRRAIEVTRHVLGDRSRITLLAELLLGRVLAHRGDTAKAAEVIDGIRKAQADARAAGQTDAEFMAAEELFVDIIRLMAEPADPSNQSNDERWDQALSRARGMTLQPQDLVEMMELESLALWRAGSRDKAEAVMQAAMDEAAKNADIMLGRLQRSRLGIAAAPPRRSPSSAGQVA